MRVLFSFITIALFSLFLHGCSSNASVDQGALRQSAAVLSPGAVAPRKEIIEAGITVTAEDIPVAVAQISEIVTELEGYVERSHQREKRSYLTARLPKEVVDDFFLKLEHVGEVSEKKITRTDVTDRHADVQAQLKNLKSLRSRYRQLLDKAKDVKDMLEIERELNRIQLDLDRLEGQLKHLNKRIDYASVSVTVEQKTVLGPVGWIFKATVDVLGKLIIWK